MKKFFTFVMAAFAAMSLNAATLQLSLADFGDTGWGDCTYNAATATVTFPTDWNSCGIGWWIAADYSAYERLVVDFAQAVPEKVQIVVEYGQPANMEESNGLQKVMVPAGSRSGEVILDASKKNAVQKIFLQVEAACSLVLQGAYLTSDEAVDPLDGLTGEDVGTISADADGNYCALPLMVIQQYKYFEVKLEITTSTPEETWGIGKIVPLNNWDVQKYEFICYQAGVGSINRYVFEQADMLEFAKVDGVYWTDGYGDQGVHIGSYGGNAKVVSVKGYGEGGSSEDVTRTEIGEVDLQYHCMHLELATLQAYDRFELVINVTDASVGANWDLGKIVPINLWDNVHEVPYKSIKAGAGEQTIVIEQADMLNYAKVDGEYYTDTDNDRQGVTISYYNDKCELVKVYGVKVGGGDAPQGIESVQADVKARKVIENGHIYILRGNQRIDLTGKVAR